MPDTLKPCPCEACLVRKYMAHAYDAHIWGEDCPYVCKQYDAWSRVGEGEKG